MLKKLKVRLSRLWQYKDLIRLLIERDIKLKYRRSFLGYLWSVLNPLMIMCIMAVVFSAMFHKKIENFPVYLFCGQICFNFMKNATNQALSSITKNAALLKKTDVPKYSFTIAKVSSCLVEYLFTMGALFIVMIATKTHFTQYLVWIPLISVQLYFFSLGLGMVLAALNVFFRDINHLYSVITTGWLYLTPIFYPIESLNENLQGLIKHFNPMFLYIHSFRQVCWLGETVNITYFIWGTIEAILIFIIGIVIFLSAQKKFIQYI